MPPREYTEPDRRSVSIPEVLGSVGRTMLGQTPRPVRRFAITTPMETTFTRREALLGFAASPSALVAAPAQVAIETQVHLFDPKRVPYAPDAPYKPAAYTLEDH